MTWPSWQFGITAVLLAGTLAGYKVSERRGLEPLVRPLATIDTNIGGWVGTEDAPPAQTVLDSLNPTAYLVRTYRKGSRELSLFVAYYANPRSGENMHSPKNCLPGGGWEIVAAGAATVPVGGRSVTVNKYLVQNSAARTLVIYWYQSRQRIVASEYLGKMYLVWDALSSGHTAGSIVRVTLPDGPEAFRTGAAFASQVIPQMQRCLEP